MSVLDTIVALASPVGESALAIIRVSGAKSLSLFREITGAKGKTSYREAIYSKYMTINGLHVDSCVFVMYKKGKSQTGEEMLEITSHGSPMIIQSILEDLQERSCRMAEPVEFSKRAFYIKLESGAVLAIKGSEVLSNKIEINFQWSWSFIIINI